MSALRIATRVIAISVSLAAAAIATAPTSGAAPGHTSCKALGALTASEAHDKTIAAELQSLPRGTIDDLIAVVQVGGTFGGEAVPAFCDTK